VSRIGFIEAWDPFATVRALAKPAHFAIGPKA
jgi:hypothetical protein